MSLKMTAQQAYELGRAEAEKLLADESWLKMIESNFQWAKISYPASAGMDYKLELQKLEKERVSAGIDPVEFPECRRLPDIVRARHKGFLDACGEPWLAAYHFNWYWFLTRRLNTRFIAAAPPPSQCTGVFFSNSPEGPLFGNNIDDIRRPIEKFVPPAEGPDGRRPQKVKMLDTVSAAVLCDEEPENIFPVDIHQVMPDDITTLPDLVEFLYRYREFWGPCNSLWIDPQMNSVAIEKSNCRMGVRWHCNGASAVTASAYLTPEMNRFKKERDKTSVVRRGGTEDHPDYTYWLGCEKRYHRLLKLVDEENNRGPTLHGLADILLDHAVPFPDRICLAGEKHHPLAKFANWTLISSAHVLFGPTRRTLWRCLHGDTPIYNTKPYIIPGKGVKILPEKSLD